MQNRKHVNISANRLINVCQMFCQNKVIEQILQSENKRRKVLFLSVANA